MKTFEGRMIHIEEVIIIVDQLNCDHDYQGSENENLAMNCTKCDHIEKLDSVHNV